MLFTVDPTPYQFAVNAFRAQLVGAEGGAEQLGEQLKAAAGNTAAIRVRMDLARRRVTQNRELTTTGAGNRFDLEQAEADLANLQAQLAAAIANEAQVQAQLAAVVDGDIASIATDQSGSRQCGMGARADDRALAVRLLRDQLAAAPRRIRCGSAPQSR